MNVSFDIFSKSNQLRKRAQSIIPGGSHTYAKGDDQYPILSPGFIERGLGCHVWDVDGNEYIEYGMGNRAVSLGHAYEPVLAAVREALQNGSNFTRPARIEVECAETFLQSVPGAEMVKFCSDGSDATSGALKLARAHTGRDLIARCGDHPFFSTDDWFIGSTVMDGGIPEAVKALTLQFPYGDLEAAALLFEQHPGRIAAFILEPARTENPPEGYLEGLLQLCHNNGALLIFDETITGFRWHANGAQALYGVVPDLSIFGKGMSNGFSVSALAGKREFMRLGGLDHTDKPRVFLLSTTHGGETHALAAAIATMRTYQNEPVVEHLARQGKRLREGIGQVIDRHGLAQFVEVVGRDCCLFYAARDPEGRPSQAYRSLLLQETIRRGILAPSLVVSYAHGDDDIDRTIEAFDGALAIYAKAISDGADRYLVGRPSEVVFRKFNSPQD